MHLAYGTGFHQKAPCEVRSVRPVASSVSIDRTLNLPVASVLDGERREIPLLRVRDTEGLGACDSPYALGMSRCSTIARVQQHEGVKCHRDKEVDLSVAKLQRLAVDKVNISNTFSVSARFTGILFMS